MADARWNSNLHAFQRLLGTIPAGARRGLDVGCGEGETSRRLRAHVDEVTGIDPDEPSIAEARSYGDDITYVVGELGAVDLAPASFDVVTAVAVLHQLDHRVGLEQLAALVAPGGLLLVVGLATSRRPLELARDALDAVTVRRYTLTRGVWHTPAPKTWPPPHTYSEAQRLSTAVLPDVAYARVPHFRYTLRWVNRSS